MKKLIAVLASASLFLSFTPATAQPSLSANPSSVNSSLVAPEFSVSAAQGPRDGEPRIWVKRLYNGQEFKFYVKYPQPGKKYQMLLNGREASWFRLTDKNLDESGNYKGLQNDIYFVRTLELDEGRNRLQLVVDGKVERSIIYTKSDEPIGPPPPPPSGIELSAPAEQVSGDGEFRIAQFNIPEDLVLDRYCLVLNSAAVTFSNVKEAKFASVPATSAANGCFTANGGVAGAEFTFKVATSSLTDGRHKLDATAIFKKADGTEQQYSDSAFFVSDNFSLKAISKPVAITGQLVAGQQLMASTGYWGPGITFSYQWFSGEDRVRGATGDKYLLTGADVGKKVSVEVTASRQGEDDFTTSAEVTTEISAQPAVTRSNTGSYNTSTQIGVVETNFRDEEIASYTITISYPSQLVCTSSCNVTAVATWSGTFDQYSSIGGTVYLTNGAGGRLGSSYLYLSRLGQNTDSLSFSFSASSLAVGTLNYLTLEIPSSVFDSRETATVLSAGSVSALRGPNNGGFTSANPVFDAAVLTTANEVARGSLANQDWNYFNYVVPTKIRVMSECMPVQVYAAPLSLLNGRADGTANSLADVTVTIRGAGAVVRESLALTGLSGGWTRLGSSYMIETKVCGLSTKLDTREYLTVTLNLSYDAYDSNFQTTVVKSLEMVGGLRWTTVNCYKGTAGQVVTGYKASCPEGWTQTKAKITNGKVEITTINCLKGTDVKVITNPEPKCPSGYEITTRAVRDGKLVPWTITCVKGVATPIPVTGVFPKCPSGYRPR